MSTHPAGPPEPPDPNDHPVDLVAARALDALEPGDDATVDPHLRACAACRAELRRHREALALVAAAEVGGEPVPDLWPAIAARAGLATDARRTAPAPAGAVPATADPTHTPAPTTTTTTTTTHDAPVVLAARRRRRFAVAATAVAAAVLLVLGVLGAIVVADQRRIDDLAASAVGPATERAADRALTDPANRVVELVADDGATRARAVVAPDGHGYLVPTDLPVAGEAQGYQLWGIGTAPVSLAVLGDRPEVTAFRAGPGLTTLAITQEPRQGSPAPTAGPLAAGALPAPPS